LKSICGYLNDGIIIIDEEVDGHGSRGKEILEYGSRAEAQHF
jgi:hypothetical protein